jgi:hypothetical protein
VTAPGRTRTYGWYSGALSPALTINDNAIQTPGYGTQFSKKRGYLEVKNLLVQSPAPAHGIENITQRQVVRNRLDGSRNSLMRGLISGERPITYSLVNASAGAASRHSYPERSSASASRWARAGVARSL